jgi:hypothetical protein
MATHDVIVERIAVHHRGLGDTVYAKACGLKHFPEPPTYYGPNGGEYRPDVYVENKDIIYDVQPHYRVKQETSRIRALSKAGPNECIIVLFAGSENEITQIGESLRSKGVDCTVIHYKDLSFWY